MGWWRRSSGEKKPCPPQPVGVTDGAGAQFQGNLRLRRVKGRLNSCSTWGWNSVNRPSCIFPRSTQSCPPIQTDTEVSEPFPKTQILLKLICSSCVPSACRNQICQSRRCCKKEKKKKERKKGEKNPTAGKKNISTLNSFFIFGFCSVFGFYFNTQRSAQR